MRLADVERLLGQQVERARYEAELARRRYLQVDPDRRLVADALEADRNARLRTLAEEQQRYDEHRRHAGQVLDAESQAKIRALAQDFPRVWNDPAVGARERKRMVRLLIEDVTLIKAEVITAHVRLRGGVTRASTWRVHFPFTISGAPGVRLSSRSTACSPSTPMQALPSSSTHAAWHQLRRALYRERVEYIRRTYALRSRYERLRDQGFLTLPEMAQRLGICLSSVHGWARRGILKGILMVRIVLSMSCPMTFIRSREAMAGRSPSFPSLMRNPQHEVQYEA